MAARRSRLFRFKVADDIILCTHANQAEPWAKVSSREQSKAWKTITSHFNADTHESVDTASLQRRFEMLVDPALHAPTTFKNAGSAQEHAERDKLIDKLRIKMHEFNSQDNSEDHEDDGPKNKQNHAKHHNRKTSQQPSDKDADGDHEMSTNNDHDQQKDNNQQKDQKAGKRDERGAGADVELEEGQEPASASSTPKLACSKLANNRKRKMSQVIDEDAVSLCESGVIIEEGSVPPPAGAPAREPSSIPRNDNGNGDGMSQRSSESFQQPLPKLSRVRTSGQFNEQGQQQQQQPQYVSTNIPPHFESAEQQQIYQQTFDETYQRSMLEQKMQQEQQQQEQQEKEQLMQLDLQRQQEQNILTQQQRLAEEEEQLRLQILKKQQHNAKNTLRAPKSQGQLALQQQKSIIQHHQMQQQIQMLQQQQQQQMMARLQGQQNVTNAAAPPTPGIKRTQPAKRRGHQQPPNAAPAGANVHMGIPSTSTSSSSLTGNNAAGAGAGAGAGGGVNESPAIGVGSSSGQLPNLGTQIPPLPSYKPVHVPHFQTLPTNLDALGEKQLLALFLERDTATKEYQCKVQEQILAMCERMIDIEERCLAMQQQRLVDESELLTVEAEGANKLITNLGNAHSMACDILNNVLKKDRK
ncbi:hypothetical protein HDU76_002869 [Blyttiomyces sp. JEL0837]|nr:hypothetical protein HDU76_002869 [Blyttiomyces sp. JEL0837]